MFKACWKMMSPSEYTQRLQIDRRNVYPVITEQRNGKLNVPPSESEQISLPLSIYNKIKMEID